MRRGIYHEKERKWEKKNKVERKWKEIMREKKVEWGIQMGHTREKAKMEVTEYYVYGKKDVEVDGEERGWSRRQYV